MTTWIAELSAAVQDLGPALIVLSGLATALLLARGLLSRRGVGVRAGASATGAEAASRSSAFVLGARPLAADRLDIEIELRISLREHEPVAAARHVRMEVAIQPGLTVRADRGALRGAVHDVLGNAISHSDGGRVLVGAGRHGGRVQISVLDDGAPVDRAEQEAHLREAGRVIALQGGTIEVTVRPGAGTTVLIRLPDPAATQVAQPATLVASTLPPAKPASPQPEPVRDIAARVD